MRNRPRILSMVVVRKVCYDSFSKKIKLVEDEIANKIQEKTGKMSIEKISQELIP